MRTRTFLLAAFAAAVWMLATPAPAWAAWEVVTREWLPADAYTAGQGLADCGGVQSADVVLGTGAEGYIEITAAANAPNFVHSMTALGDFHVVMAWTGSPGPGHTELVAAVATSAIASAGDNSSAQAYIYHTNAASVQAPPNDSDTAGWFEVLDDNGGSGTQLEGTVVGAVLWVNATTSAYESCSANVVWSVAVSPQPFP